MWMICENTHGDPVHVNVQTTPSGARVIRVYKAARKVEQKVGPMIAMIRLDDRMRRTMIAALMNYDEEVRISDNADQANPA